MRIHVRVAAHYDHDDNLIGFARDAALRSCARSRKGGAENHLIAVPPLVSTEHAAGTSEAKANTRAFSCPACFHHNSLAPQASRVGVP